MISPVFILLTYFSQTVEIETGGSGFKRFFRSIIYNMPPTPKSFNLVSDSSRQGQNGPSSLCWSVNLQKEEKGGFSTHAWGGNLASVHRNRPNGPTSLGWDVNSSTREKSGSSCLGYIQENSSSMTTSKNNESLPKFADTFSGHTYENFKPRSSSSSEFSSWSSSSSRRNSSDTPLFGDSKKKVNWDRLVDKVFKEEIVKMSDHLKS